MFGTKVQAIAHTALTAALVLTIGSMAEAAPNEGLAPTRQVLPSLRLPSGQQPGGENVINVPCSSAALYSAITLANENPAALRLSSHCTYNIATPATATDALPIITGTMTLVGGPSTTIRRSDAAGPVRILEVATTGSLHIEGIFILNGAPAAGQPGGGIQNNGELQLVRVTLSNNTATAAGGGGLNNTATGRAVLSQTVVGNNTAGGEAPGGDASCL